jgi:putative transposase
MRLRKVYRFQMQPTASQERGLLRMAGARRFLYNWALERRRTYYQETGKTIPAKTLSLELTALKQKPSTSWLKEVDSQLLQQALKDVDRAFTNFFERRARYPRFKSRKREPLRFRIPQRVRLEKGKVYVPKVGWVRVRQSQDVTEALKSATFKQDATGKWYVALTVEFEAPDTPLPPLNADGVVGIDLGLSTFATLSDGEEVPIPRFYRKAERKLKRAQRALSRKQKGSRNREKARKRVARVHRKIANKRTDFIHQVTHRLTQQYEGFCTEDLNNRALARTKLGKSILDAALGEFRRQLTYKSLWYRRGLAVVDRFYPSTKRCGECGAVNHSLTLSDRWWICPVCGAEHSRDLNAARNLREEGLKQLAVGHTERQNACRVPVSLSTRAGDADARIPSL